MSRVRHSWSARKLHRELAAGGLLSHRPTLALRFRWPSDLPRLPNRVRHCYRPYELSAWPEDWRQRLKQLESGWKYLDIWPSAEGVIIQFLGYADRTPRPLLAVVADFVVWVQSRGTPVRVGS